jgi:hypothetical protein
MQSACAVLYCHLWSVWVYRIFPNYHINDTIFGLFKYQTEGTREEEHLIFISLSNGLHDSRGSSVGAVTRQRTGPSDVVIQTVTIDIFLSPETSGRRRGSLTFLFGGHRVSFRGVKTPGRNVVYSNPSIAQVKN